MASKKKYVELLWAEKYDDYEKGEKISIEKPNLPFQVVETVNKPRIKGGYIDPSLLFPEDEYPENYPKDWKNLLIWGDNKLVMSSLIKQGWAGEINLIYIDPPFFTGADFTVRTKLGDERIEKEPSIIEDRAYRDTWSGGIASYLNDLSKFAIQVTRKRLLDIHNSKDLLDEKRKQYGKPARPFELWNIGNYETAYWQEREDEYLAFMLKLYQSQLLTGFRYLHGRKGDRAVHVGPLNAHVTREEVEKVVIECRANNFNKADVIGWEWGYGVNELAKELAKKNGVDLRLIQIPSLNEIKSALVGFDLKLLKRPEQVVERELAQYIKFPEVAYLEIETEVKKGEVTLKIIDFQLPPTAELAEIASKVKDLRELIDYWAIDWDYKGDTSHNQWQSFRVKRNPKVDYEARHKYKENGEYQIMVKVVDVFGNDTNKVLEVKVK
jgi:hypothetical protein